MLNSFACGALLFSLCILSELACNAQDAALVSNFERIPPHKFNIKWATKYQVPAALGVYEAEGSRFPELVVSNLMTIGQFNDTNAISPVATGVFLDKGVSYYADPFKKRFVGFVPAQGWIIYHNAYAYQARIAQLNGVPDETNTVKSALALLDKIGVQTDSLATNEDDGTLLALMTKQDVTGHDKVTRKPITKTLSRGVIFSRSLDGLPVLNSAGQGNVYVEFACSNQISVIDVVWKKLTCAKHEAVASRAEINQYLQDGSAFIQLGGARTRINNMVITDSLPFYLEGPGNIRQRLLVPFLLIEARIEFGFNSDTVTVVCPLLTKPETF
jgi:hypothetical protein